jgi:uncharacterized protein (DUF1330 family)
MAAYWIIRAGEVKDQDALKVYQKLWAPVAVHHKAKVITRSNFETPEGPDFPRVLIIEFPTYQQAISCYQDPDYQQAIKFANQAFDREMTIIDGV